MYVHYIIWLCLLLILRVVCQAHNGGGEGLTLKLYTYSLHGAESFLIS